MNKLRKRLLKSRSYYFPIFALISFVITYLLSSYLGKAKPIETFRIFISGIDFDTKVLNEKINSYKTSEYDYLLVFDTYLCDEDDESSYYSYDYQFQNEAIPKYDLIIYSQSYFEETFTSEAYAGHFNKIDALSVYPMFNEYAVKIHDKNSNPKDERLGITFSDDNYLISINNKTVHYNESSDAANHFLKAFIYA